MMHDFLADFELGGMGVSRLAKERRAITLQVSPELKARYDKLQDNSGRKFSKKAREVLQALIEAAEAKGI